MIDLKGDENIAGEAGPEAANEQEAGRARVEKNKTKPVDPGAHDLKPNPGGPH